MSLCVDMKMICDEVICDADGGLVTLRPFTPGEKRPCAYHNLRFQPADIAFYVPGRVYTMTLQPDCEDEAPAR